MSKLLKTIDARPWVSTVTAIQPAGVQITLAEGYAFADSFESVAVFATQRRAHKESHRINVIKPSELYVAAMYKDGWIYGRTSDSTYFESLRQFSTLQQARAWAKTKLGVECLHG